MMSTSGRLTLAADRRGWLLADQLWERLVEAGLAAFDAGRLDDAGALWISALAHAERFAGDDPRRATALNDIAAVRHLSEIGRAVEQECRDRDRMQSSA